MWNKKKRSSPVRPLSWSSDCELKLLLLHIPMLTSTHLYCHDTFAVEDMVSEKKARKARPKAKKKQEEEVSLNKVKKEQDIAQEEKKQT